MLASTAWDIPVSASHGPTEASVNLFTYQAPGAPRPLSVGAPRGGDRLALARTHTQTIAAVLDGDGMAPVSTHRRALYANVPFSDATRRSVAAREDAHDESVPRTLAPRASASVRDGATSADPVARLKMAILS